MPDVVRIILDIMALLAVVYAIVRGIFAASADVNSLKSQVIRNTAWIEGHEVWSAKQTGEMQGIREDIAYIRGQMERGEKNRYTEE